MTGVGANGRENLLRMFSENAGTNALRATSADRISDAAMRPTEVFYLGGVMPHLVEPHGAKTPSPKALLSTCREKANL